MNWKNRVRFDSKTIFEGHHAMTYRGIKAIKCPFDYVLYQMLIFDLKPDLIIEIGTHSGGSALYLSDLLRHNGGGVVHTIDIKEIEKKPLLDQPDIQFFSDGWQGYDLNLTKSFNKILVIEDGSHTYADTIGALRKFSPVVSEDSYLIVEDGIVNKLGMKNKYNGGPLKAIKEFLSETDAFAIDRHWCDFFGINATFNVNGFLKKIKHK